MDVILLRRKPYSRVGKGTDLFFNKFTCQLVNLPNFFGDKFHMLNSATTNELCFLQISLMALPTDFRTYSLSSHLWAANRSIATRGQVANHPYKPEHTVEDGIFITEGLLWKVWSLIRWWTLWGTLCLFYAPWVLLPHFWECVKLFEKIWGYDYVADAATVSVHINRLREKIEDDARNPKIIETVWGAGYRLNR